ncbi:uncharacterized protein LOC107041300 [Diachasma alloeum]|uniref:uncharacterized protein LOC107041300 n=1 Tax=Diachasma alloeum TaxID=454923 RepID=UPI0007384394|nr:uncharacterized protein LOC107041300 [Diachasma alloeum]
MGDLPSQRVRAFVRPFAATGIDYACPLQVSESHRRGRVHVTKGYVAVFTFFSTKSVHLELVSDLTTEASLAALSRFTARHGLPSDIFSDNGTNFVGAATELQEVFELLSREEKTIATQLAKQRIGAAVKSMKRHLSIVTEGRMLTFEEYNTLLANIKAVLNPRPLTPITNDLLDFRVLTPSHFLIVTRSYSLFNVIF